MSTHATSRPVGEGSPRSSANPWAGGFAMFAAVLMMISGVCGVLAGISAILRDEIFVSTPNYLYTLDLTTWGWVHLILGALLAIAGLGVVQGATWARVIGVVVAGLALIANFVSLPYYPLWAILLIALDVVVIWALATYRPA